MKPVRVLAALAGAAALSLAGAGVAAAQPVTTTPQAYTCTEGFIPSGTYTTLTIAGSCVVPDGGTVTVLNNLIVNPHAMFNASTDSTVNVHGSVIAGTGSTFALGCTPAHPCDNGEYQDYSTNDTVNGNVVLNGVYNAALNGDTIGGSIVSTGGGAGSAPYFVPFSIKDNTVGGSITVSNLSTVWFGVIRNQVGGNVVLSNVHAYDPDGNEVVANTIAHNLVCSGNNPANWYGDAIGGYPPPLYGANQVGGVATGQCAALTTPPVVNND